MKHIALSLAMLLAATGGSYADTLRLGEDKRLRAAAQQVLTGLQSRSFRTGREFCGLLGRNKDGAIVATRPRKGSADSCLPHEFRGRGIVALASYHTHGAYDHDADSEVPSYSDLSADIDEGLIGFIATPGGRLWVNLPDKAVSRQLCGIRCLPQDRHFQQGDWGLINKQYTLRQLKQRLQLY
ncbi:DUF4329 domain-containing protein [Litoreibacter albidus]|uniref:DUF4329 domain-containing protein n=1 Tax=Litoreibacter albidus TaxID=670155 RepID=A0A1H2XY09_9RHOB|nr:DUF4329 domain-containing protein [Litoreibacter albidus]SDW97756.1 protein of unknown function [Litoreibacter albidus]